MHRFICVCRACRCVGVCGDFVCDFGTLFPPYSTSQSQNSGDRASERERKEKHTPKTPANANFISFSIENVRVVLFSVVHKFNTLKIN